MNDFLLSCSSKRTQDFHGPIMDVVERKLKRLSLIQTVISYGVFFSDRKNWNLGVLLPQFAVNSFPCNVSFEIIIRWTWKIYIQSGWLIHSWDFFFNFIHFDWIQCKISNIENQIMLRNRFIGKVEICEKWNSFEFDFVWNEANNPFILSNETFIAGKSMESDIRKAGCIIHFISTPRATDNHFHIWPNTMM